MKCVYLSTNRALMHMLQHLLTEEGMETVLQGEHLQGAVGELPVIDVSLWVLADRDAEIARQRVEEILAKQQPLDTQPWRCHGCGEEVDAQFSDCWKCGMAR